MARNMSFFHTQEQILDQSKTVTRRLGWWFLKPGDILNAVEKSQGLGKGGKINKLCQIRVVSVRKEPLRLIVVYPDDCRREGFPRMSKAEFVAFFCSTMKCEPETLVNRIEFEYIDTTAEGE